MSVASAPNGDIVACGTFDGAMNLGGNILTSVDGPNGDELDFFVAKLSSEGEHVWSRRYGGLGNDICASAAVDADGNVVIVGHFANTVDFGGQMETAISGSDLYVLKLDSGGDVDWVDTAGSAPATGTETATHVAIDAEQAVWTAGYFHSTINLDGFSLVNAQGSPPDFFIHRQNSTGTATVGRNYGGSADASLAAIAADPAGGVVVVGTFNGTVDFYDGHTVTSGGDDDIFVAKLDAAGATQWAVKFGEAGPQNAIDVAVLDGGVVALLATAEGQLNFGGGPLPLAGGGDVALALLDASGGHIWSASWGDAGPQSPSSISADSSGNLVLAGQTTGGLDFGLGVITAQIFVAKLDPSGIVLWSQGLGDGVNVLADATTTANDGIVGGGTLSGSIDFGGEAVTTFGAGDAFVFQLDP